MIDSFKSITPLFFLFYFTKVIFMFARKRDVSYFSDAPSLFGRIRKYQITTFRREI